MKKVLYFVMLAIVAAFCMVAIVSCATVRDESCECTYYKEKPTGQGNQHLWFFPRDLSRDLKHYTCSSLQEDLTKRYHASKGQDVEGKPEGQNHPYYSTAVVQCHALETIP